MKFSCLYMKTADTAISIDSCKLNDDQYPPQPAVTLALHGLALEDRDRFK